MMTSLIFKEISELGEADSPVSEESLPEEQDETFTAELKSLNHLLRDITRPYSPYDSDKQPLLLQLRDLLAKSKICGGLTFSHLFTPAENYGFREQVMF